MFTPDQVRAAIVVADQAVGMPLPDGFDTALLLNESITPALEAVPPHHRCEVVEHALKTMFLMGLAVGIHLERES